MAPAGLSLQQAPPFMAPARFFLTAPWFGCLAGLALTWIGPAALTSRWSPVTVGITHLVTLGFLTTVAVGALLQLLPVLTGVGVPRAKLVATAVHGLLVPGTLAFSIGLLAFPSVLPLGLAGLALALAIWVSAFGLALHRVRRPSPTVTSMRLALTGLGLAVLVGLTRGAALAGVTSLDGWLSVNLHFLWALIGWLGLLVSGVAYQVVPMFQVTPEYPILLQRAFPSTLWLALLAWSGTVLAGITGPKLAFELIAAGALAIFALWTLGLQARRRRKLADVTLWYWRLGMLSLLGAIAAWLGARFQPGSPSLELAAGVLYIVGFLQSVVTGMLYKILPFLVWLHTRQLSAGVSNMQQVLAKRPMRAQFWCHGAALSALLAACWYAWASRAAGVLYALACAWLGVNLWRAAQVYRRALRQAAEESSRFQ